MTHTVPLADHPLAAGPLTELYLASRKKPLAGTRCSEERNRLARAVGAGKLADVLRSQDAIRVRPKGPEVWEVIQEDGGGTIDRALVAVLNAEAMAQGLNRREIARRAGLSPQSIIYILDGVNGPNWMTVKKILAGLEKSLTWLDEQMKASNVD